MKFYRAFFLWAIGISLFIGCKNNSPTNSQSSIDNPLELELGKFLDARDNQHYPTVKIGEQTWLASNVKFKADSTWCYEYDNLNCERFGRLYPWEKAKVACPAGWHLPSLEEWKALAEHLGSNAQLYEKEGDKKLFNLLKQGGEAQLNLSLSGFYNPTIEKYGMMDKQATYWSSTRFGQQAAMAAVMNKRKGEEGTFIFSPGSIESGHACRCIQD